MTREKQYQKDQAEQAEYEKMRRAETKKKTPIENAIAMQGTPFTLEYLDGDTIACYVKKFDPKKGLSCWSLELVTAIGYEFFPEGEDEIAEQAVCMVGVDLENSPHLLGAALKMLKEIARTGKLVSLPAIGVFGGCPL